MTRWIDELAEALGQEPLTPGETAQVLELAREVAHGIERRLAPLSTFLAGLHVGRSLAEESSCRPQPVPREEALRRAVARGKALLPSSEETRPKSGPG